MLRAVSVALCVTFVLFVACEYQSIFPQPGRLAADDVRGGATCVYNVDHICETDEDTCESCSGKLNGQDCSANNTLYKYVQKTPYFDDITLVDAYFGGYNDANTNGFIYCRYAYPCTICVPNSEGGRYCFKSTTARDSDQHMTWIGAGSACGGQ